MRVKHGDGSSGDMRTGLHEHPEQEQSLVGVMLLQRGRSAGTGVCWVGKLSILAVMGGQGRGFSEEGHPAAVPIWWSACARLLGC
jgi:hypothetical protein